MIPMEHQMPKVSGEVREYARDTVYFVPVVPVEQRQWDTRRSILDHIVAIADGPRKIRNVPGNSQALDFTPFRTG